MSCDPEFRLAIWYDRITMRPLAAIRQRIVALCRELKLRRVLDYGCGTGVQAALLHAEGFEVTGVDRSEGMLRQARRQRWARPDGTIYANPPLVLADHPLPFSDQSFDAVLLSLILHETDDNEAVLAEAFRVAPRVLVLEWRMPERNLDLPAQMIVHLIERMAGKEHYDHFRRYGRTGWLRGLAARAEAVVDYEEPVGFNTMVLAVLRKRP